jgi:hypothetical protein
MAVPSIEARRFSRVSIFLRIERASSSELRDVSISPLNLAMQSSASDSLAIVVGGRAVVQISESQKSI